jgi:hypothetical protein
MSSPTVRWELFIVLGCIACATILGLFMYQGGPFSYSSVCSRCGIVCHTTKWQLPGTRFTVFDQSSERDTPVSLSLRADGIVGPHSHQWLFAQGGGNGVRCALGEGRYIRPALESEGVASILYASQRFGEIKFRDRLVRLMFDPKTSQAVRDLGFSAPTNRFIDATEFRAWLDRETEFFDEMIAMYQER